MMIRIRTGLVALACAGWMAAATAQTLPSESSTHPDIEALIEQLGDHRFTVRDEATERLSKMPAETLDELVRHFRAEQRHEQKLRLRVAIENVYYRKLMSGQTGFMGITPRSMSRVYDPKTGQQVECMLVVQVVPDNPAERAGVRDGDIILDFDGQPIANFMKANHLLNQNPAAPGGVQTRGQDLGVEAFTAHVKMRAPGSAIKLRLLRLGPSRQVRVPLSAHDGPVVDGRTLVSTALARDGPGLARMLTVGGLVVTHVPDRSWMDEVGLQVNDVIVGIEGQIIDAGRSTDLLEAAFKVTPQKLEHNPHVTLEVRALEQVDLILTLGARPPRLMNLPDWQEAQSRFANWWRDEVGEVSLRIRKSPQTIYFAGVTPTIPPDRDPEVVP